MTSALPTSQYKKDVCQWYQVLVRCSKGASCTFKHVDYGPVEFKLPSSTSASLAQREVDKSWARKQHKQRKQQAK